MNAPEIRWGILGTGNIASQFVEALLQTPGARVLSVGSRSLEKARSFANAHGIEKAYGSYEELVSEGELDVVYVATPNSLHSAHCLLALDAGKAVLCEKPFALNAAEARGVIEKARAKNLFCMEAMWMRFMPAFKRLSGLIEEGAIGGAQMIWANLGMRIEGGPEHRLYNPMLGGGALLDLGVYTFSFAQAFFGSPLSVQSSAALGKTGVDEQCASILRHRQGQISTLSCAISHDMPSDALIMGSRGFIRIHAPLYRFSALSLVTSKDPLKAAGQALGGRGQTLKKLAKLAQKVEAYLPLRELARQKTWVLPYIGNGYAHEAMEVMRCLREGLKESPSMPWQQTLDILEAMDSARACWTK